jgi:hypothetical protein
VNTSRSVIGFHQSGLPNTAAHGRASCGYCVRCCLPPLIAEDFKFHSGQTMPELRLHYKTVGEPTGQPVLLLRLRLQRRNAGLSDSGADGGEGRQDSRRPAGRTDHRRCQRLHLPMGIFARLRPFRQTGADRRAAAGDQCRGRRTQSAGNRPDGDSPQAREERQALPDPGERPDARPRHDRQPDALPDAVAGFSANSAATRNVRISHAGRLSDAPGRTCHLLAGSSKRDRSAGCIPC